MIYLKVGGGFVMSEVFAKRLKSARELKGWTQEYLAEMVGVTNGAISGYERNYREPDLAMLAKISKFLDVSVDYLLGNSDIKQPDVSTIAAERKDDGSFTDDEFGTLEEMVQHLKKKYGTRSAGGINSGTNTEGGRTTGDNN
jgi:transcriptional regulator with XRE-family HTH domain